MTAFTRLAVLALAAGVIALPAAAAATQPESAQRDAPPQVYSRVAACQAIREDAARLACFDREVAAFAQAQASREVVVVDRAAVQRTRRSLFGLSLPDVGRLFGDGDEEEITGTIAQARGDAIGLYTFALEGGAVWVQTEGRLPRPPRPGHPVRIRRGILGSYLANIDGQRAIRVIRRR